MLTLYVIITLFKRFRQRLCFVWDDSCRFCERSKDKAKWLDWLDRLEVVGQSQVATVDPDWVEGYTPEQGDKGMFIRPIAKPSKAYYGFYALRRLVWALPLTWVTIPFWYIPGVPWTGERVYAWIAANRKRFGGCKPDGTCDL